MTGMMLLVSRRVTGPLAKIQDAMLKLAGGNFEVVLPGLERKDEIGAMANAVEKFKVLAVEKARHEADEAIKRQQIEADLQAKAAAERAKTADEQAAAFRALGVGLGKLSEGDLTFRLSDEFSDAYRKSRTTSTRRSPSCRKRSRRSQPPRARSPMRHPRSRPARATCRSAPRSRPRASNRRRRRWKRCRPR